MLARRRGLSGPECARASAAVCGNLLALETVRTILGRRGIVAAYLAYGGEIDLSAAIDAFVAAGVPVAAPRWNGKSYCLALLRQDRDWRDGLANGYRGIPEPDDSAAPADPSDVELWLVPGVAFAPDGRRLGYGGGWYDRFLSAAAPGAAAIGVAYGFQMRDDIPAEPHDRRVDAVATPEGTVFGTGGGW